jgi:hypothetical protein
MFSDVYSRVRTLSAALFVLCLAGCIDLSNQVVEQSRRVESTPTALRIVRPMPAPTEEVFSDCGWLQTAQAFVDTNRNQQFDNEEAPLQEVMFEIESSYRQPFMTEPTDEQGQQELQLVM